MTQADRPLIGVVEAPDLARALTLLGFESVGGGEFRSAALAIRSLTVTVPVPVVVRDVTKPGLRAWIDKQALSGSRVVILRGATPGSVPAETGFSVALPATINSILASAGWGPSAHPLGEETVAADGSIAGLSIWDVATVEPEPEPEPEPQPAPEPEYIPAPAPASAVMPAPAPAPVVPEPQPTAVPDVPVPGVSALPDWLSADFAVEPTAPVESAPAVEAVVEIPAAPSVEHSEALPDWMNAESATPAPLPDWALFASPDASAPAVEENADAVSAPGEAAPAIEDVEEPLFPEHLVPADAAIVDEAPVADPFIFDLPVAVPAPEAPVAVDSAPVVFDTPAVPVPVEIVPDEPVIVDMPAPVPAPAAVAEPMPTPEAFVQPEPQVTRAPVQEPEDPFAFFERAVQEANRNAIAAPTSNAPAFQSPVFTPDPVVVPPAVATPTPSPVFVPTPEPTPAPAPAPVAVTAPVVETVPVVAPAPAPAPVPAPEPAPAPAETAVAGVEPQPQPQSVFVAPVQQSARPHFDIDYTDPAFARPNVDTSDPDYIAPDPSKVIISFAGKGGVGKTKNAISMAERGAMAGLRVALVDMNRGQGDVRTYLHLGKPDVPSILTAAHTGNVADAVLDPETLNQNRPRNLPPLGFATVLAPPPALADPQVVTTALYREAIEFLTTKVDLVVVDTQIAEEVDNTRLIEDLVIPLLRNGAWGLGISDRSIAGLRNLLDRVKSFNTYGVAKENLFVTVGRVEKFTPDDTAAMQNLFNKHYATFAGAIPDDPEFAEALDGGVVNLDGTGPRAVIDYVLRAVTGSPAFDPPAQRRRGFFGRRK